LYRFPFDLTEFRKASGDTGQPDFYFRITVLGNPDCQGESRTVRLNTDDAKLSIDSPLRPVYNTDGVMDVVISATALPDRDVQCSLVHDGVLWDSTIMLLVSYVTGPAGSKQQRLVRQLLPSTLSDYGDTYILCETVDKGDPSRSFSTKDAGVKFRVEKGVGRVQFTAPTLAQRWRAGTTQTVSWSANLTTGNTLPTIGGSMRLYRLGSVDAKGMPSVLQQWDVNLASLNTSVLMPDTTVDGNDYYLSLVVSASLSVQSPLFAVDPASGSPSPPTPVPSTAGPDAAPPTGFTVATVLTPRPTPPRQAPAPTPFVPRTIQAPSTTPTKTTPKGVCGTRANGEVMVADQCGVCGGNNACSSGAVNGAGNGDLPIIIGATVGGVLCLIIMVVIAVVVYRRHRGGNGARRGKKIDDRGAGIVLAEDSGRRPQQFMTEEGSIF
jgi:hypothetical protein